uniref:F-box domain-containing protein n=1 Tax=Steinernema glaseri TaxID=37863 RepID=A0A1I7Z4I5_9BILA
MDTVPRLFVEKVLLCLRDHPSLRELYTIPALWGEVCTASCQKIHTLDVFVHSEIGRLYTAAQPFWLENQKVEFFSGFLHKPHKGRRSHNWKFLTHFRILKNMRTCEDAVKEFCANAGPLYRINCDDKRQSKIDELVEKFVPVNAGKFVLHKNSYYSIL